MIYHFGQFELDMARVELRKEGAVQRLEPQVFSLVAYLIEHRERLVPKSELFEKLWDGRVVTDSALTSRIKSARQALGDSGKAQQFIKTIHSKGFRFIADVRFAHCTSMALPGDGTEKPGIAIEPAQRPLVAVSPVRNATDASSHDTFADGMARELITELARLRWLLDIARREMDSARSPFERTVRVCRRCAAQLNSAALTQLDTSRVELKLVKPVSHCPENKTRGRTCP
jgi:DNA-binding winged helix-turn-helix (wHTH) protein